MRVVVAVAHAVLLVGWVVVTALRRAWTSEVIGWISEVVDRMAGMPATRRSYRDPCGIARALDAVGERWALLVVRELLLGPKRFTDLAGGLPGVSTDVLSQRLRELEAAGVLERATLPPPAASKVYALTARGRELEPVVLALGRWGSAQPLPPGGGTLGVDALVLALPTRFDARRAARGGDLAVELRLGEDVFAARVAGGALHVARGAAARPDAVLSGPAATLREVLWHGRPAGDLAVAGSRRAAARFLRLFPRPG